MEKTENHERIAVARQRGQVYGLLATVYRQEPSPELLKEIKSPDHLEVLSDLGVQLKEDFLKSSDEEVLESLAVEFARLFLGPGKHISPHESVHHKRDDGDWGQLWGASTVEVKRFIETTGLSYDDAYKGMPDHISVELEFMQQVTQHEEQAWAEDDKDAAIYCQKIENKFIEDHLVKWIPDFCDKVAREAELPFYRDMAALTKNFIEFEKEEVTRLKSEFMEDVSSD